MAVATRGFHPLHFEDLDPHRFEDLVRQLAYDFRLWRKLEATGRSGADAGFDARGLEIVADAAEPIDERSEEPEEERPAPSDRLWLIQCKREKSIGPKKLVKYLADTPQGEGKGIYGIIFAAACDFSKTARDAFREKCRSLGVSECYLWGKSELEDMLYQPKNDHLLFAYFGISLTIRRRSVRTDLRTRLSMKRKANRLLKDKRSACLLIRDPEETRYPNGDEIPDFDKKPTWRVACFDGFNHVGLKFVIKRFIAYLDDAGKEWDVAFALDDGKLRPYDDPWRGQEDPKTWELRAKIMEVWQTFPEHNRAWFELVSVIPYTNVLDIDELGDGYVREPHIYAPFKDGSPYERAYAKVEAIGFDRRKIYVDAKMENRIEKFPAEYREGPDRPKSRAEHA